MAWHFDKFIIMIFSKTYTFKTKLAISDAIQKLKEVSDNKSFQIFINRISVTDTKRFSGQLTANTFIVKRNLPYFNSFRPSIEGKFISHNLTTQLLLKFSVKWWILLITFILLGLLTFLFIGEQLVANAFSGSDNSFAIWLMPLIDIVFISTIIIFFNLERKWALVDLKKILQLEELTN